MKFSIIVSNTRRSYEYLKLLVKVKKFPNFIIHLDYQNQSNYKKKILNLITKKKINFKSFKGNNVDDKRIEKYILNLKEKIIVYSGYGGKIVKSDNILKNKYLLHSHTGKLPEYKGSTTIFYSLLKEKKIYCTTFIMNSKIDCGNILYIKNYPLIKNKKKIENYDNKIRAKSIVHTLQNFQILKKRSKNYKNNYPHYYIMHPILRYIALKK